MAEGVSEGGILDEVGVQGVLLLFRRALDEVPNDAPDLLD